MADLVYQIVIEPILTFRAWIAPNALTVGMVFFTLWALAKSGLVQKAITWLTNRSTNGASQVYIYSARNNASYLRKLLELDFDAHTPNLDGVTPLCIAAAKGNLDAVVLLLHQANQPGSQIDINAATECGVTPLMAAAHAGHTDVVQVLLIAKADTTATFGKGWTAFDLATLKSRNNVLSQFKTKGQGTLPDMSKKPKRKKPRRALCTCKACSWAKKQGYVFKFNSMAGLAKKKEKK